MTKSSYTCLTSIKCLPLALLTAENSGNLRSGKTFCTFTPRYCPQIPWRLLNVDRCCQRLSVAGSEMGLPVAVERGKGWILAVQAGSKKNGMESRSDIGDGGRT